MVEYGQIGIIEGTLCCLLLYPTYRFDQDCIHISSLPLTAWDVGLKPSS